MPYPHYIIIDTETSGMPERIDLPMDDAALWPHILQLAWLVLDSEGNLVKEECHYLKNPGVQLDTQSQQLHGITPELLKVKGVSKRGMIKRLHRDIKRHDALLIGHFIEYDIKMLSVERRRLNLHLNFNGLPTFCTMLKSGYKSHHPERQHPSLAELYQQIFRKPMEQPHHALHDARASAMVFLHLLEEGKFDEGDVKHFDAYPPHSKFPAKGLSLFQKIKQLIKRS